MLCECLERFLISYDYQRIQWEDKGNSKIAEVCQRAEKEKVLSGRGREDGAGSLWPQGVLGVAEMPEYRMEELMEDSRHAYILLDDIRDPGNLGTILRTAEGAGMSGVVMSRGTVDIFNPKVVRATMGAIFRVPFCYEEDLAECIGKMKSAEIPVYGTMMDGNGLYDEPDYSGRVGVVIGNEANGISGKVAEALTGGIRIPMEGRLESLNASVAAAVLMYEIARQRRRISPS